MLNNITNRQHDTIVTGAASGHDSGENNDSEDRHGHIHDDKMMVLNIIVIWRTTNRSCRPWHCNEQLSSCRPCQPRPT